VKLNATRLDVVASGNYNDSFVLTFFPRLSIYQWKNF